MSDAPHAQTYALIADLGKLAADFPVDGSLVLLGRQLIDHSLSWSDERAGKLARVVDALCTPLLQAGRALNALILEYDEGALLVVTRDALRVVVVMRSMVERPDDLIAAASRILETHGEAIFKERGMQRPIQTQPRVVNPKPTAVATVTARKAVIPTAGIARSHTAIPVAKTVEAAPAASPEVHATVVMEMAVARLAMVMGRKAAADLVAREAAKAELELDSPLNAATGQEFIARIFAHVPHKAKRESLTFECQKNFLESLK